MCTICAPKSNDACFTIYTQPVDDKLATNIPRRIFMDKAITRDLNMAEICGVDYSDLGQETTLETT